MAGTQPICSTSVRKPPRVIGRCTPNAHDVALAFCRVGNPARVQHEPEVQSGLTSTKFSPKGRYQASKAYLWACALLGRQIQTGELDYYDPLFPIPCRIKTTKEPGKDFVKVTDVESWPEGQQALAPSKDVLLGLRATSCTTASGHSPRGSAGVSSNPCASYLRHPCPDADLGQCPGADAAPDAPATAPKW